MVSSLTFCFLQHAHQHQHLLVGKPCSSHREIQTHVVAYKRASVLAIALKKHRKCC